MTDTRTPVETIVPTQYAGDIEIATTQVNGTPTVHLDVTAECVDLTASEALNVINGMLRAVDRIGFPEAPFPPIEARMVPGDDLAYLGMPS